MAWPEKKYGTFFQDDSYIVLHSYKKAGSDVLLHCIHFWLGHATSQDELGTAAYKSVELDDYLDGRATQYREVQGSESPLFLSYFKHLELLSGGAPSGFHHFSPETHQKRLLQVRRPAQATGTPRKMAVLVYEVNMDPASLNAGDVFVLDAGNVLYQFQGKDSAGVEKVKAAEYVRGVVDEREGKAKVMVVDQSDQRAMLDFWQALGSEGDIAPATVHDAVKGIGEKKLFRLATDGRYQPVQGVSRAQLDPSGVYILDASHEIFCWIGQSADVSLRKGGLQAAQEYLKHANLPLTTPICKVYQESEPDSLVAALG